MISESSSTTHLMYSTEQDAATHKVLFLGFVLLLPLLLCGMITSYTSVALPQMNLGLDYSSSFVSLSFLISPVGSIIVGFIIDKYGRRTALLFSIIPGILGWLLLYVDYSVTTKFVGQILNGLLCGAAGYPSQVYAGECVMANNVRMRNRFLSWIAISNAIGMLLTYVLGYFINYKNIAAFGVILAVISFLLIFCFIPESPAWLYLQGRAGDAEWSQKRLGIYPSTSEKRRLSVFLLDDDVDTRWSAVKKSFEKLKRKDVYKPLLIAMTFSTCLSFIGGMSVVFYMVGIINEPLELELGLFVGFGPNLHIINDTLYKVNDSYVYSLISGALMVVSNILMSILLPLVGVKMILIVPLLGMGLGMGVEGYATQQNFKDCWFMGHIGALWLITFMYTSSILTIPDYMTGDLFPVDAKGFASFPYLLETALVAAISKFHPYIYKMIRGYLYYFYGTMCVVSALFVHFFIPEIVGKSLFEINNEFLT